MSTRFVVIALVACKAPSTSCDCVPTNAPRVGGSELLLQKLRTRMQAVRDRKPGRDVKLLDDDLRLAIGNVCDPCNAWIPDRVEIEELYPLDRLDDAVRAVCLGFELSDGSMVHGARYPKACL